jgi:hypothetical protein
VVGAKGVWRRRCWYCEITAFTWWTMIGNDVAECTKVTRHTDAHGHTVTRQSITTTRRLERTMQRYAYNEEQRRRKWRTGNVVGRKWTHHKSWKLRGGNWCLVFIM